MKNIYYVPKEKRYIGRKQFKGQIITVHAKTQLECKEKLQEQLRELTKMIIRPTKKRTLTFKEFVERWYKQDKEPFIAESTKKDLLSILRTFKPIEQISLSQLSKDVIQKYLNDLPKNRTKEKVALYLRAILKNALANGLIKKNPFDLIVTDSRVRNPKEAFTYEEQIKILDALKNNPLKVPIIIYLITGLRKNELNFRSIEKDIDFESNTLKAINLKGRNLTVRYKRIRLSEEALTFIMNNLDILHKYDSESCYREFLDLMKKLGIKKSIVNLRHTFATNHLYLGTPDFVISKEMGHSTSQITKDNYMNIDCHLSKERIFKLYNNLYSIFQ